jgi:hypothetical protein
MAMSNMQRAAIEKARVGGASGWAVALNDQDSSYLLAIIVRDLGLNERFPELPVVAETYYERPLSPMNLDGVIFWDLMSRLVELDPNADSYFTCLAKLHRSRLKYDAILRRQPFPTMNQVGPRGLLQFGSMSPPALTALLFWRKWLFDVDNRSAQETGYLFEPILAAAVGGAPVGSSASPVRRQADAGKGRQVDCIRGKSAYEFKLRITIAASGQGRWREELEFATDAAASGFTPMLVVFDDTENDKLDAICKAFGAAGGHVYKGQEAWRHLDEVAGPTMAKFIDTYVKRPIQAMLEAAPDLDHLPALRLAVEGQHLTVAVGDEEHTITRQPLEAETDPPD